jgi:hypothetical protein
VSVDSSSRSAAAAASNIASTSACPRAVSSTSRARLSSGSGAELDVAEALEVSQHVVDGLLAGAGAFGDDRRTLSVGARPLEHRPVSEADVVEAGGADLAKHLGIGLLPEHAEQRGSRGGPASSGRA